MRNEGASYALRATVGQQNLVLVLQYVLGLQSWTFSGVPRERWLAREFVCRRDAEDATRRQGGYFSRGGSRRCPADACACRQLDGVAFVLALMSMGCRGSVVADEMGLGKTLQALVVMSCLVSTTPALKVLVVCPGYLRQNWVAEAQKWGVFDAEPQLMKKLVDRPVVSETGATFVLSSYEWVTSVMELKNRNGGGECLEGFDLVVFGRGACSKNGAALRTVQLRNRAAQHSAQSGPRDVSDGHAVPNATRAVFAAEADGEPGHALPGVCVPVLQEVLQHDVYGLGRR